MKIDNRTATFDELFDFAVELLRYASRFNDVYDCVLERYRSAESEFDMWNGADRVVIYPYLITDEWVIKFDRDSDESSNACRREAENYKKACECGLGNYFAATYKIGEVGKYDIYAQERCSCDEDAVSEEFYNYSYERIVEWDGAPRDDEEKELCSARAWDMSNELDDEERLDVMFGFVGKLENFCWDNNINDLHAANFGYRIDTGCAVIVDYAGYIR